MTNMTAPDSILDRIQKLQALADRAGTEAEAFNAATRVRELLDKYNLEIGEVELRTRGAEERDIVTRGKRDAASEFLLKGVGLLCGVGVYWFYTAPDPRTHRRQNIGRFYGSRANVEAAVQTYAYLEASVSSLFEQRKRGFLFPIGTLRIDLYRAGAGSRILERIQEWIATREMTNETQAIILVTDELRRQREAELMQAGLKKFPVRIQKAKRMNSYREGRRDAERVDLHGAGKQVE